MYSLLLVSTMLAMSFLATVTHCDFTYKVVPCKMDYSSNSRYYCDCKSVTILWIIWCLLS